MPTSVIDHIRRTVLPRDRADDGELLGRFIERRDEAALAALINRHGPMVWGVCRRLLGHHDAEDAFQATFIVLVRKAASISQRETVGNWLYGVAHQAALQARRTAARRRVREVQVTEMPDTTDVQQDHRRDVQPLLDEELSRLPDHYRTVIVLSDLEGKTRKEVAAQLGCPEGTVASRLVRARSMLAKRLTRRGVALSGRALAAALSQNVASAGVPASVVMSTIKAVNLFAAGQAAIPLKVAALAEGVLKTMLLTKLKSVMAVLVVAALVGLIGFGVAMGQQKGDLVAPQNQESEKAQKFEDEIVKEKVEKEVIAWGKEVDGLQMGLALVPKDVQTCRQGEMLKVMVKLRNVGKAKVTVDCGILQEWAPQVTTNTGGRVTVYVPPPFGGFAVPLKWAFKPGETITLCNPEVFVESEDRANVLGEMLVNIPTICVKPGKYKIAFGGMIQSHPTLTTGAVEVEVKNQVAWGKEIGGLKMGLVLAGAPTYHLGEKIRMEVKVRNVSEAPITITYGVPQESAPQVTVKGESVYVQMPPTIKGFVEQMKQVLKAGETITLYKPEVALKEQNQEVQTGPLPPVGTPTIQIIPHKYKIAYSGMLESHPKLATGTAEFEVKDHVAWGKEIGGLQAGLGIAEKRAYHTGETVKVVLKVRNVGKKAVGFRYIRQYLDENPPTVTGADSKTIPQHGSIVEGLRHVPVEVNLEPGKEIVLESRIHGASGVPYELRPANRKEPRATQNHPLHVGTGKVSIQYERVFGSSSIGRLEPDPTLSKLPTGKLELEVKAAEKK